MDINRLLNIAADSQKMGMWNDSLSHILDGVDKKTIKALSDDELLMVAGGVNVQDQKKTDNVGKLR